MTCDVEKKKKKKRKKKKMTPTPTPTTDPDPGPDPAFYWHPCFTSQCDWFKKYRRFFNTWTKNHNKSLIYCLCLTTMKKKKKKTSGWFMIMLFCVGRKCLW